VLLCLVRRALAASAQARIGLDRIDNGDEIVEPDDPFKLETGAVIPCPDNIGFDPSDNRKTNDNPLASAKSLGVIDHETIYYRPPENYLEPGTLMAVLRKLIVRPVERASPPANEPPATVSTH